MKHYKVTFNVPAYKLDLIAGLIKDEVDDLAVAERGKPAAKSSRRRPFVKGKEVKDTRLGKLALDWISSTPKKSDEFGDICERHGFSRNSAGATLSRLAIDGVIVKTGIGMYKEK